MHHGRKRAVAALASTTAIIAISLMPAAPSSADPDVETVRKNVDKLYHQAEVASERHNDAKLKLDDLKADLDALKADEKAQQKKVEGLTGAVSDSIAAQYEGQSISTTGKLVLSQDPDAFLEDLTTLSAYNDVQSQKLDSYTREVRALEIRREATQERAEELASTKKALAKEKASADSKLEKAEQLLSKLTAAERAEVAASENEGTSSNTSTSRTSARVPATVKASGRASDAINYAIAQVGKGYVHGGTGPSSFDCSGLTMMAWAQAGVSLPHSSQAQMGSGTPVSISQLQPGDLVFYYSPVSHVGIYIGNGQIVHAANPRTGVAYAPVSSMPISGAVRPG
ncbi:cell wall-associated NlpC family hydrolase [Nocardioides daedukensis]|uniref:Cell wall-associated NlpC family hydrolase n=1 Tax=Nocardioides daedukensis TaxID=634462 RepID=A0A7Y9S0K8_9ACTN|nr:C40 family peptidase [Nocardioides daedukensis]NYG58038.1 cell wall-associated NlpC family hydrolase [Nocardioides daedukensis]